MVIISIYLRFLSHTTVGFAVPVSKPSCLLDKVSVCLRASSSCLPPQPQQTTFGPYRKQKSLKKGKPRQLVFYYSYFRTTSDGLLVLFLNFKPVLYYNILSLHEQAFVCGTTYIFYPSVTRHNTVTPNKRIGIIGRRISLLEKQFLN